MGAGPAGQPLVMYNGIYIIDMRKIVILAALAAFCAGFSAYAQTSADVTGGGISAEMLEKISKGYQGTPSDKAIRNALAGTSIGTLAVNSEKCGYDRHSFFGQGEDKGYHRSEVVRKMLAVYRTQCFESQDDR